MISALNPMIDDAAAGQTVFYRFYSEAQRQRQSGLNNTGLFFFRGRFGAPFAVISPGGGFSYVGSVHEGFPYAEAISRKGYNAFVLKYRAGEGGTVATQDLAAVLSPTFIATRRRWASVPTATLCGVVRLEREWQPQSVRMEWRNLEAPTFQGLQPL